MGVTDASFVVKDKEASDVGRFLNRILGLSVERQNLVSIMINLLPKFFTYPKSSNSSFAPPVIEV